MPSRRSATSGLTVNSGAPSPCRPGKRFRPGRRWWSEPSRVSHSWWNPRHPAIGGRARASPPRRTAPENGGGTRDDRAVDRGLVAPGRGGALTGADTTPRGGRIDLVIADREPNPPQSTAPRDGRTGRDRARSAVRCGPGPERNGMRTRPGNPYPLGATWDGSGVNFSLFSENATGVELCLFDRS